MVDGHIERVTAGAAPSRRASRATATSGRALALLGGARRGCAAATGPTGPGRAALRRVGSGAATAARDEQAIPQGEGRAAHVGRSPALAGPLRGTAAGVDIDLQRGAR